MTRPKNISDKDWQNRKSESNRIYYITHKDKINADRRCQRNPEKERSWKRKAYWKNRDHYLAKNAEYRCTHPEIAKALYVRTKHHGPSHRTPEAERIHRLRRRTNLSKTTYSLTDQEIKLILGYGCLICDIHDDLTLAHDLPVIRGGGTNITNCFCLCRYHNSKMHTQTLEEFFPDFVSKRLTQLSEILRPGGG